MENLTIQDVIEFLYDHDDAAEDFCDFFCIDIWEDDADDLSSRLEIDKAVSWLFDHEQLSRDFLTFLDLPEVDVNVVESLKFSEVEDILAELFEVIHY